MIELKRSPKIPDILVTNEINWTVELLSEIDKYGSFTDLPDSVKSIVGERYKHEEIKSLLVPNLDTKCAFCESMPNESGYIEIEHYLPKSIYPNKTYSWENLLPSCKRCNLKKLSLDTGKFPIVKPDIENPSDYFTYNNIKMIVKEDALDKEKAARTITRLDLNQYRLIRPRSELLVSLVVFESNLELAIDELSKAKNSNKISRLLNNIMESLDQIDELRKQKSKFSGFCRDYITKSSIINKAKEIVETHLEQQ